MKLPTVYDKDCSKKRIILRLDTDISVRNGKLLDDYRLAAAIPTITYLLARAKRVIMLGHRGRPEKADKELSLKPVARALSSLLKKDIRVFYSHEEAQNSELSLVMLENLRFWEGEEKNDPGFARQIARLGDFYVNEAFADSHREHASIVGLPKLLPHAAGLRFSQEVSYLSKVLENPREPVVIILGGAKSDKAKLAESLLDHAEYLLVGGLLPHVLSSFCRSQDGRACLVAAHLLPGGLDIDGASIANFVNIIKKAGTIVWNGPMGKYEDKESISGTQEIARVIAASSAFKIVGGGDTIAALEKIGLLSKMDWVSVGGGAMLEFLAKGDLPGIAALRV